MMSDSQCRHAESTERYHRFLKAAACPACLAALAEAAGKKSLVCGRCGASYPVEGDVPILLTDASKQLLASGRFPVQKSLMPGWIPPRLAGWIRAQCLTGPGTDRGQRSRLATFVGEDTADSMIVDLGAGGRRLAQHVLNLDVDVLPCIDVVADGHALPFADASVTRIVCTGVLEHVEFPDRVVAEMNRVLQPGGRVYVAVPFMQGFHPGAGTLQDFRRYTQIGLMRLLADFRIVEWGTSGGPSAALAWILREYLALVFAWSPSSYRIAFTLAGPLTAWLRWFDCFLDRFHQSRRIACGFYMIGEKPGNPLPVENAQQHNPMHFYPQASSDKSPGSVMEM